MKRYLLWLAASAAAVSACAPVQPTVSPADRDPLRREVVADVAEGIAMVMEPTVTRLVPAKVPTGAFDHALLAALRARGYAIATGGAGGARLNWRVEPLEGAMYRVSVDIGSTRLSRLWVVDGARAYSGGAWARRG